LGNGTGKAILVLAWQLYRCVTILGYHVVLLGKGIAEGQIVNILNYVKKVLNITSVWFVCTWVTLFGHLWIEKSLCYGVAKA